MSIHEPDSLLELMNVKPNQKEKKENGEVFTPLYLVNEMLDKLDEVYVKEHGKSIFSEPTFKWFDPAVGIGNFPFMVYQRLMKGLQIPEEERRKHILEQMIYSAELTPKNVLMYNKIFCGDQYKLNMYEGDTLNMDVKKEFNLSDDFIGFDVVMGNPPYNVSGNIATGNTIWQDFTKKSINEWLKDYLLFVHPSGWRKPTTKKGRYYGLYNLMCIDNQMLYLKIHGLKDGKKTFNCGTRYDWYLIEKKPQYKNTIIIDEEENKKDINLREWSWLPNSQFLKIKKILANPERCEIIYDRTAYGADKKWMSKETSEFKYPCIHSTPKSGIRYMYSKFNDKGHFGVSKVIFGESGIYNPVIDMEGKYGMTHGAMAIKVDTLEEATYISKVIESDTFNKILRSCSFSLFRIDWNIFKEFKKDFWKEFLTQSSPKELQIE